MRVTIEIPEDLARLLGENSAGLGKVAMESLALESIRAGKNTLAEARRFLSESLPAMRWTAS
jgi:hypothetical protein